jgi:hypothetical protein
MEQLASLDEQTHKPPLSRIGCATNARRLVADLKQADKEIRGKRRTKIQGLLDGNPPWVSQTLRDKGQGHRTNLNFREGEGMVDAAKTPYYDLIFEVPKFANIYFDRDPEMEDDPSIVDEWNEIFAEEYHDLLDEWQSFDFNVQLHQWEMCVHGIGTLFWHHGLDWRSSALKYGRLLVPDETLADVDELELAVILHTFRADQLYKIIQKEGAARAAKWEPDAVKRAIARAAKDESTDEDEDSFEKSQQRLRNGDLLAGVNRSRKIRVATILVKEFDGKVSHYIVSDDNNPDEWDGKYVDKEEENGKETGYLYKCKSRFDSFSQVICPFFFDVGPDGTWHSIKGLGPKIYDFCDVSNRTGSQLIDAAVIGSSVPLEATDANAVQETQLVHFGGHFVVQPGFKISQFRLGESVEGALLVRREFQNIIQSNTGQYRQRVAAENMEPTLGQAQLNATQQAVLGKGAVNRYYKRLDAYHRETIRRLLNTELTEDFPGGKEAVAFREKCIERGIPEEMMNIDKIRCIKAQRALGYGSAQAQEISTQGLLQLVPFMDEQSRNNALRARSARLVGQHQVDAYFPSMKKAGFPDDHTALATLENNALRTGGQVIDTPRQNHATHFKIHFADTALHLQQLAQGENPNSILTHLDTSGPHLNKHLVRLQSDPTREKDVKQMMQGLQMLGKAADQLRQQITEMMQKAEGERQQPQLDPDLIKALAKIAADAQIKREKLRGDMQLKAAKLEISTMLADKKQAAEINRQTRREQAAAA